MNPECQAARWSDRTIAVVGGDEREQEIARLAAATGATVKAYGFPWPEGGIEGVTPAQTPEQAFQDADFALFPIPGISASGALFAPAAPAPIVPTKQLLGLMKPHAHIVLGWGDDKLKAASQALGITLHEYEWDEDLMLLRGPAIVEGLLKVLIENTRITIHRARIGIVGQGTIGFLLTRCLVALGAHVHVFARNPVQRAAAHAANAHAHELGELGTAIAELDILLSTVPARVVGQAELAAASHKPLLVDLAAPPGGIDFDYAQTHGFKAIWARGLGRRAPVTVGQSQWSGIKPRLEKIMLANRPTLGD